MSELSYEAKALIRRVGTADGPGPVDRGRVKRRIVASLAGASAALGGGGTVAAGAPAGALGAVTAAKMTLASVALWLAAGLGLGMAVSTPAIVSAYRRADAIRAPVPVSAPVVTLPPKASERTSDAPVTPSVADNPPAVSREAAPERAVVERPRAAPSTGAASLAEETRLLNAAQHELAQKHANGALGLLDEHASRFPGGALAEERTALRVLALCDLGRTVEARRAADVFIKRSPSSPLVPRLRGSCAGSETSVDTSLQ